MAIYEVNGSKYELPDGIKPEEALGFIQGQSTSGSPNSPVSQTGAPAQAGAPFQNPVRALPSAGTLGDQDRIDPSTLSSDQDWLDSAMRVWQYNNADPFKGTAQDLAEYGLDTMGWFNYNLPMMAVDAARLTQADTETKRAFVQLMDKYDNLQMSWGGAGRFIKGTAADPTTWTGLASLGVGTIARSGAKLATKEGIREILKAGLVGAADTAVIAGIGDTLNQDVRVDAGTQDKFSYGQLATSTGLGAIAGEVLGAGARSLEKVFGKQAAHVADTLPGQLSDDAAQALKSAQEAVHAPKAPEATPVAPTPENPAGGPLRAANENVPEAARNITSQQVGSGKLVFKDGELVAPAERDSTLAAKDEAVAKSQEPVQPPKEFDPNDPDYLATGRTNDNPERIPGNENDKPNVILAAIQTYVQETGAKMFQTGSALSESAAEAVRVITSLKPDEAAQVVRQARLGALGPDRTMAAKEAFKEATQKLGGELKANRAALDAAQKAGTKDFKVIKELTDRVNDLQRVFETVRDTDLKFSSITGHELASRVGYWNTGLNRDVSVDTILKDMGHDPSLVPQGSRIRREAEATFQRKLNNAQDLMAKNEKVVDLQGEIDNHLALGDNYNLAEAIRKTEELNSLKSVLATDLDKAQDMKFGARLSAKAHRIWLGVVEYTISTVFKTSTLLINLVPHLIVTPTRPLLDFVLKGGGSEAYASMKAGYVAMGTHFTEAMRAAVATYRYEADLLGAHGAASANKYLEHTAIIPGKIGGAIRFFPRVLSATDQLFKRTNYRSYVATYSASQAFKEGIASGLKPGSKQMKDYIQQVVDENMRTAFKPASGGTQSTIDFLRQQAIRRGMKTGTDKQRQWILQELRKNADLFKEASSETGRNFADDMAFRREFSGEGSVSSVAKAYEQFSNNHPWMKFFGQLFFRTPVRIFEEGARLTPGLNIITPKFLSDLRGVNGESRQLRAQAEAMLSLAFAAGTFNMYAQGRITGGGSSDWRKNKDQVAAGFEPYTVKFGDGTHFTFRNFDPFGTPFKIMVNALDRIADMEYRTAQGENVDQTEYSQSLAHIVGPALSIVQAAIPAVAQSVKDANLTQGISELIDFGTDLADPDQHADALMRFLAKKVQLAIPNQYTQLMTTFEPDASTFHDPKTFDQYIQARVNPGAGTLPKRYDALGNEIKNPNPFTGLWGVPAITTGAQRDSVMDEKSAQINAAINELQVATGQSFTAPYNAAGWATGSKFPTDGLKSVDLRTILTKDGKETLYDRLQRYVGYTEAKDVLYKFLVKDPQGTIGTPTASGTRTEAALKVLQAARNQSFLRLIQEEGIDVLLPTVLQAKQAKLEGKAGLRDAFGAPFQ